MKKIAVLFLIGLLVLGGCGTATTDNGVNESTQGESGVQGDVSGQEDASAQEDEGAQGETDAQAEENAQEEGTQEDTVVENKTSFFAELPDEFFFSSGAGGWGTELYLQDDGTFHGQYHDSDMGSIGDDYPNGTVYISQFKGKFAEPVQVSEYVYSTTIEYMDADSSGEEYIEDGIRYIVSEPYGLENAGEIFIYMYGASHSELPEGFLSWVMGDERGYDSIRCYGIYNVNAETGFTGVKYEAYEEICKLNGSYQNEAGDRVEIQLSAELDEYSYELGSVQWMPHDGEGERGAIVKNAKGGFTICLEDSIQYNFEMTGYEAGKIEFTGADQWSEQFGTFVMQ